MIKKQILPEGIIHGQVTIKPDNEQVKNRHLCKDQRRRHADKAQTYANCLGIPQGCAVACSV